MATIKLSIFDDFVYFWVFSGSQTRGSGAGAPDMDHVIQQNDYLVKPYQDNKRNIVKKHFCHHGNHKTGRFGLFLSIFKLPDQDFRGRIPLHMGQVIHRNDRLVKPYQDHKKNVDKNIFCYHGNHKTWRFCLFLSIFRLPNQGFGGGSPRHGSCNTPKWLSSQTLSDPQKKHWQKAFLLPWRP